jgi:predicted nicotinamide N-methyase
MVALKARYSSKALDGVSLLGLSTPADITAFILANTAPLAVPHCPSIKLYLAHEAVALWQLTEAELEAQGLPLPFWAFAWAGGQGLARYVLDNPTCVAGKRVLDLASGSGLVGISAKMAGASHVTCADIDPFCQYAIKLNADHNNVDLTIIVQDLIGTTVDFDLVLVGDLFYERDIAEPLFSWLKDLQADGTQILIGDPGRTYLPKSGLRMVGDYQIAVSRALEDAQVKRTRIWVID